MSEVVRQVTQIVADLFYVDPDELSPASSPETIEDWDSLQHLNLVLALEEVFGLEFTPDEIAEMKTIGAAANLIEQKSRPREVTPVLTNVPR